MSLTRRHLLHGASLLGVTALAPGASAQNRRPSGRVAAGRGPVLVAVFLRGGADGLQVVPPVGDGHYYDLRPRLALAPPGSGDGAALDLDGFFGLHPALLPLKAHYDAGTMAVVHAAGSPSDSHSHFESQDLMERGRVEGPGDGSGWLGRHLAASPAGGDSLFRAIAVGPAVQTALAGEVPAFAVEDVEAYGFAMRHADPELVRQAMLEMYDRPDDSLDVTTRQVFEAMDVLSRVNVGDGGGYPPSPFGTSLRTLAALIREGLGVEVATVDSGGWDHHDNLAAELEDRLTDLAAGLDAFVADLGAEMQRVTVVVMTEFGRRAEENASLGTDHGHGGVMLALGGGVNGGRVVSDWPGLAPGNLYGTGDLDVTVDYRQVLGEALARRLRNPELGEVFPGYAMPGFLDLFRSG